MSFNVLLEVWSCSVNALEMHPQYCTAVLSEYCQIGYFIVHWLHFQTVRYQVLKKMNLIYSNTYTYLGVFVNISMKCIICRSQEANNEVLNDERLNVIEYNMAVELPFTVGRQRKKS